MVTPLTGFMVGLAIDPEKFHEFITDPQAAAVRAGVSQDDLAVLFSGDQNRIYAALTSDPGEDR
jgi:hypothetical protein